MYDQPFDENFDPESIDQMHTVMTVAIQLVLEGKTPDEFLEWAQLAIPHIAPLMFADMPPEDIERTAYWMGVNLWNAAPQPSNYFKPNPLPKPSRNNPCPCGSGRKYKQCCSRMPVLDQLPAETFWPIMSEVMSKATINRLIKNNELPVSAVTIMAAGFADVHDDAQVIKMLDPLFEGKASKINHKHSGLLDMLCDSYNALYKTDKKKKDLLDRMSQHKDRVLRAEAWQRIASWQEDRGNHGAAMDALTKAIQADPNNISHSLLELTILVSSKQIDQARKRAKFWYHRFKPEEYEFPEFLEILREAQYDPLTALQTGINSHEDDMRLPQLLDWINESSTLPVPSYQFSGMENYEPEVDHPGIDPMLNAVTLIPPEDIIELEMQWQEIKPLEKPFSIQYEPYDSDNVWDDIFDTEWLAFLQENPGAINSLDILDDLITILYIHPNNHVILGPLDKNQSLAERAERIIRQAQIPKNKTLPWIMPENRTALRAIVHHIDIAGENDEQKKSFELIQLYLTLNPNDNHGYRCQMINHYLRQNRNEQALQTARPYPNDMMADINYGRVLAQYRLGDLAVAEQSLRQAIKELPLVAEYLIKGRIAKPELSEYGIQPGGEDQAWLYRDEMRDVWKQTKGCLDWLEKQCA